MSVGRPAAPNQKALRHGKMGSTARLRNVKLEGRNTGGVKEPVFPVSEDKVRAAIAAQLCPWCGAGPFAMLPVHTNKIHGVDKWELRDYAGYTTSDPLCSEEVRDKMRDAYDPARGAQARATSAGKGKRKMYRRTKAGIARNSQTVKDWMDAHPEEAAATRAKANAAAHTPEAIAKRRETMRTTPRPGWSPERLAAHVARLRDPELAAKRQAGRKLKGCPSRAAYRRGCKCDGCRAAYLAYKREHG